MLRIAARYISTVEDEYQLKRQQPPHQMTFHTRQFQVSYSSDVDEHSGVGILLTHASESIGSIRERIANRLNYTVCCIMHRVTVCCILHRVTICCLFYIRIIYPDNIIFSG